MASFPFDQAEGLRRMVCGPRPRVLSVLSAASAMDKQALLVNLSASLTHAGSKVLLLDATLSGNGLASRLAPACQPLLQVARGHGRLEQAVTELPDALQVASVARPGARAALSVSELARVSGLFSELAACYDVTLVDAELDGEGDLLLPELASGEVLVQVSDSEASITGAYGLIKRLHARLGRRPMGLVVSGCSQAKAATVYRNMAQAASRYLAVELHSLGFVPDDEQLRRANCLGRSVVDAFPLAGAAAAFRHLAGHYARGNQLEAGHV